MHKSQIFFYILGTFILGVFMASFLNLSLSAVLILGIVGISIILFSGLKNKYFILAGFLILAFAGGLARFSAIDGSTSGGNLTDLVGSEATLIGYIDSEPETDGNRARFVFSAKGG